ncbi:hypothetical protein [Colwellia sp. BRX8-4]|uniref:hypothetical protein n=1 Tax=Colwellia sp. BRX8-4 TaxID=2759836 RepID=UPI002174D902|nr:hypothetical protein [Colwellia sp. BRX8-4]
MINARLPVLAAFDSDDDLNNWTGESLSILKIDQISSGKVLKATLIANQQYTNLTLNNFHKDWEGYHTLNISVYLEGNDNVKLCIKITDMINDIGNQTYDDRFNYCTLLTPKTNNIVIPVNDIRTSPELRYLDITNLSQITFFAMNLLSNKTVYIRAIELQ